MPKRPPTIGMEQDRLHCSASGSGAASRAARVGSGDGGACGSRCGLSSVTDSASGRATSGVVVDFKSNYNSGGGGGGSGCADDIIDSGIGVDSTPVGHAPKATPPPRQLATSCAALEDDAVSRASTTEGTGIPCRCD